MAETTETVQINDAEMFRSIMSDEPLPEPAQEPAAAESDPAEQTERARDEQGRFVAAKTTDEQAKPAAQSSPTQQQTEPKDDAGQVPSWRLREVREAREAAERRAEEAMRQQIALQSRMQAMEAELRKFSAPKEEPADFFADPQRAINQQLSPIQQEMQSALSSMRLEFSREMAVVRHGADAVSEMEAAVEKAIASNNPEMTALSMRMRASNNPVAVAMDWYRQSKLMEQTGGDLEKYRQKVLDDALKDPAFQKRVVEAARSSATAQAQQPNSRPVVQIPPSLNKTSGSSSDAIDDNDASDSATWRYIMGSPRR